MGEHADSMLDGTMCASCGVFLNDEPLGYADYCSDCQPAVDIDTAKRAKPQPLSKKLHRRLLKIEQMTDHVAGMYAGERIDMAPAMHRKLINRGLAREEQPHNPAHFYPYVVITDKGRRLLKQMEQQA